MLVGTHTYTWVTKNTVSIIGYFYDNTNTFFFGEDALAYILKKIQKKTTKEIAQSLHGIFSIIIEFDTHIEIISDRIDFFPIFYFVDESQYIYVSDSWWNIQTQKKQFLPNEDAYLEFLAGGFVLGHETLDKTIKKTKAGEICCIYNNGLVEHNAYQSYIPLEFRTSPYDTIYNDVCSAISEAGNRLEKFLQNRTAVIPLSGGYDSRLIACMLKKMNYQNVICFTYGVKNKEQELSQQVAEILGYPWFFIDYTQINTQEYLQSPEFIAYAKSYGNGFAMPYMQEYFAVKFLKENKLIPLDSVFLPGHRAEYIKVLQKMICEKPKIVSVKNLPQCIEQKIFNIKKKTKKQKAVLHNRLRETLCVSWQHLALQDFSLFEGWTVSEKYSKFIFRSSFVYPFFGYQVYLPLWDKQLMNVFLDISSDYKVERVLYRTILEEEFFKPNGVCFFEQELHSASYAKYFFQYCKDKIRYIIPWGIVYARMKKTDWMGYSFITLPMHQEIRNKTGKYLTAFKNFNAVICRWHILFTEKSLKN